MIVTIEAPANNGECVTHVDGKVIFVSKAIWGERVEIEIVREKKKFAWAKTVRLLDPSPLRRPHIWAEGEAKGIGGCELGHVTVDGQSQWKTQVIANQMRKIGGRVLAEQFHKIGSDVRELGEDPRTRTRVEFEVHASGQPAMYRAGTKELVPIESMPLAAPAFTDLEVFSERWQTLWVPGDRLRAIMPVGEPRLLIDSVAYSAQGERAKPSVIYEVDTGTKKLPFEVSATGFWQPHRDGASALYQTVMKSARGEKILELFSGAGLFSVGLSKIGQLTTIEGSESAVRDAKNNLQKLGAQNVQAFSGKISARTLAEFSSKDGFDLIVLDPPRAGAGIPLIRQISALSPARIIYIACDIAALARDGKELLTHGYELSGHTALDLFPNTYHVEQVAVFDKAK
ncbi:MAG: RsmD family RNA methyltransferase [Actinomycetaceae bacterium]|nr:RsmD family RNA methyltransferase [Actinomycetaceae bacterium]